MAKEVGVKNILLINSVFGAGGGAETIATHLLETFPTKGIETSMISGVKLKESKRVIATPKNPIDKLLKIIFKKDKFNIENILRYLTGLNDIFFAWPFLLPFKSIYRKADIINLHNLHGHYFSILALPIFSAHKRVFWTLHDTWAIMGKAPTIHGECTEKCFRQKKCEHMDMYPKMYRNRTRFIKKLKKWLYHKCDMTIICPSEWLKDEVIKSGMFPDESKIMCINNGIDLSRFEGLDKMQLRKEFNLPTDKKIVFFQAAWVTNPEKGIMDALQDIKIDNREKTFILLIGYFSDQLEPLIKASGIDYKVLSYIDNKEAIKYFAASDVLAFPSWYENLSTTMIESLAAGTPVVAFDTGGNKEIVDHLKNGYIAKWKDYDDFWYGVNTLLSLSKDDYNNLSKNAKEKAHTRFSLDRFINNYLEAFRQAK